MNNPKKIITHTAVSNKKHTAQDVDVWHKARWNGFTSKEFKNNNGEFYHVGYHYVIEWDGTVVQTRGDYEEGAHCIGMNTSSIGICCMGDGDKHLPSKAQIKSFQDLFFKLAEKHKLNKFDLEPHRKYANKSCHGSKLSDTYWQDQIHSPEMKSTMQKLHKLRQAVTLLTQLLSLRRLKINEK